MDTTLQKKPPYLMIAILFVGAFVSFLNNSIKCRTAFDHG
jgi:hypothetical protein